MRWLMVHPGPNFSVADVHNGWAEALRGLGEQVAEYNLDRRITFYDAALIGTGEDDGQGNQAVRKAMTRGAALELAANGILSAAMQTWPDVVLITSAFFIPPWILEVLRGRRMRIVMLFTESPYQDGQQLDMAKQADLVLLNDPVNISQYREITRAEYAPHAYRPAVHYPAPPGAVKKWDLSFIGTGFPSRARFFEAMDLSGLAVNLAGPWMGLPDESPLRDWTLTTNEACVDNDDTAGIYRASACGINFYRRESEDDHAGEGWAMGPREVELAACGTWFCRDPRGEGDEVFGMLPTFGGPEEAAGQIRWALARPAERERAAAAARQAIADRTFENSARRLLQLLDNLGGTFSGTQARQERTGLRRADQRRGGLAAAVPGVVVDQHEHRQARRDGLRGRE